MTTDNHEVIFAIVNSGYAEDVGLDDPLKLVSADLIFSIVQITISSFVFD